MRMYNLGSDLINDVIAGLTVGIMQLPQGELAVLNICPVTKEK